MSSRHQRLLVVVLRRNVVSAFSGRGSSGGAPSCRIATSSVPVGGWGGGGGRRFFVSQIADATVKPSGDALYDDSREGSMMTFGRRFFVSSVAAPPSPSSHNSSEDPQRCCRLIGDHRRRCRRIRRRRVAWQGGGLTTHQNSSFSSSAGADGGGENDDDSSTVSVEECAGDISRLMMMGRGREGGEEVEAAASASARDTLASELARDLSPSARREVSDAIARRRTDGGDRDEEEEGRSSSSGRSAKSKKSKSKEEGEGERVRTACAPLPIPIPSTAEEQNEDDAVADDEDEEDDVPEPSREDLRLVALTSSVPFVGFGFMDNFILILAGEAIDVSLGVALGISTMCAAAIGNIVSDVAGVMLGTAIEDVVARMGLPVPDITEGQRKLRSVRFAGQFGVAAGLVVGCVLGMCPLLWIDTRSLERRKKNTEIDGIFRSVVTDETRDLVGAEHVSLFFVSGMCDECGDGGADCNLGGTGGGDLHGRYLWAKYTDRVEGDDGRVRGDDDRVLRVPLDRKSIKRRVVMTGEAVNLVDAREDPDYDTLISVLGDATRSMMIVPVFNAHGEVIAVIQAMNKVRRRKKKRTADGHGGSPDGEDDDDEESQGFTSRDMQVLQALASHLSVYLGNADAEDGIVSFGDSIRRLKDHGVRRSSSRCASSPIPPDGGGERESQALSHEEASIVEEDSSRGR